jgi:hypothetical protein
MFDKTRYFVRVYIIPDRPTQGYCFGGWVPITFKNVDWFGHPEDGKNDLVKFIKSKRYYNPRFRYLVLGDHPNLTFTIDPEGFVPQET